MADGTAGEGDFVLNLMDFVLNLMDFVLKMCILTQGDGRLGRAGEEIY